MRMRRVARPVGLGLGVGVCFVSFLAYGMTAAVAGLGACKPHMKHNVGATPAQTMELAAPTHLVPGEEGIYDLHIRGLRVGRCELRSGAVQNGKVQVTSVVQSDGLLDLVVSLRDEVSTLVDLGTGKPVSTRGSFAGMLTGKPDPTAQTELPWQFVHHNGHSLLFALRGWDADAGTRAVTTLVVRGGSHRVDLLFARREVLHSAIGAVPAVRIEGAIEKASSRGEPFHFVLWLADDWTRAVLRLDTETDFGEIASARIVDYEAPGMIDE
jgi:hypothetical protein